MKPKIFISGKITGDPMYKAKFAEAENFYKKKGYIVLNPAVLPSGMQLADYMRICFAMIDTADAVSFLPDFKQSAGADIEHAYCCYTDKNIRHFEDDIGNTPYAAQAAEDLTQPMAAPVINMPDPIGEIKKAVEKSFKDQFNVGFCGGVKK